jgi:hypothetical protein
MPVYPGAAYDIAVLLPSSELANLKIAGEPESTRVAGRL